MMNRLHVLAIGSHIIAAAHYVRDGAEPWYAAWVIAGVILAVLGDRQTSITSHKHTGD